MKAITCWNYDTDILGVPDKSYVIQLSALFIVWSKFLNKVKKFFMT